MTENLKNALGEWALLMTMAATGEGGSFNTLNRAEEALHAAILAEPVSDNPKLSLAESQIADK